MATAKREFIPNQVFIGLPWKTVRPKYERVIKKLEKTYPVYLHYRRPKRRTGCTGPL